MKSISPASGALPLIRPRWCDGSRSHATCYNHLRMECTRTNWAKRVTSLCARPTDQTMHDWWRSRKSTTQQTCCDSTRTFDRISLLDRSLGGGALASGNAHPGECDQRIIVGVEETVSRPRAKTRKSQT